MTEVPRSRAARHRRILGLAIPAIGALVADPLLGLVDTAVVGRLGPEPLGAMGLSISLLAMVTWIFNFLAYGTTAAVARAIGAGDRDAAGRRAAHAGVVAVALGTAVGLLLLALSGPLIDLIDPVPAVRGPALVYLRIRAVGVPFALLGFVGHGTFRGVSDTRTTLVVTVIANIVNAALDVVLVLRLDVGLAGAAWATVAAEVLAAVLFAVLARRAHLPLRGHGLPSRAELSGLVTVSRDLVVRTGALLVALFALSAAAARIDAVTAAAHQVLWQVWVTVSFLLDGFAIAAQAMIGTSLGEGDEDHARATARDLVAWGVGGGAVIAIVLLALAGPIPRLLTDDPAVLAAVAGVWWLAAGGHVLNGVVFVLDGVFMGAGAFGYLRTWTLVAAVPAVAVAVLTPVLDLDLLALWLGLEAMMLVRLTSLVVGLRGRRWVMTKAT